MGKTLALRKEEQTQRHELTAEDLASQAKSALEIKDKIMKVGVHYGVIPGFNGKPSLFKPGAEKLCAAFMLQPQFETVCREDPQRTIDWEKWDYKTKKKLTGTTKGYIDYDSSCTLVHIPSGEVWVSNVSGSCNNFEAKYRSLNPFDVKGTLAKMGEKRAFVAAVLIATALSDMFTQDIEDMPYLNGKDAEPENQSQKDQSPIEKENPKPQQKPDSGNNGEENVRMATEKQVVFIKNQLKKYKISPMDFLSIWERDVSSFETIPFHLVNAVLEWIRKYDSNKK